MVFRSLQMLLLSGVVFLTRTVAATENVLIDIPLFADDYGSRENTNVAKVLFEEASREFPSPVCLSSAVDFWKLIYTEVDDGSVAFHDREQLDRVYGVVNVPGRSSSRRRIIGVYQKYFENKLRELANLANQPLRWSRTQRDVAMKFGAEQRTAEEFRAAADRVRGQSGLKRSFSIGVSRSLKYLPIVVNYIEKEKLPLDLAILPHVESSYNPAAVSRAGAEGMWQIMPDTMKFIMGSSYVRYRKNPDVATRAALKLLKRNFEKTQNWPLALTAYNHGLGGILRAVDKANSKDFCTIVETYKGTSFGFASKNFYAQFLAARSVSMERYSALADKNVGPSVLKTKIAQYARQNIL